MTKLTLIRLAALALLSAGLLGCGGEAPATNTASSDANTTGNNTSTASDNTSGTSNNANTARKTIDLSVDYDFASGQYQLRWPASTGPVDVLRAASAAGSDQIVVRQGLEGSSYQLPKTALIKRPYFALRSDQGQSAWVAARWLALDSARNLRDLGGYPTASGERLRWGLVFRSGALAPMQSEDMAALSGLGVNTLVDFRGSDERQSEPTQWPVPGVNVLQWDYRLDKSVFAELFRPGQDLSAEFFEQLMVTGYRDMVETQRPHYAALFEQLSSADDGVLFHCTAGKDRTGIAAAVLLTALGVERELVLRDFMLSDQYYRQYPEKIAGWGDDHDAQDPMLKLFKNLPPETLAPLTGVRPSYLEAAFAQMEADYGSVMNYVRDGLGVDEAQLQQLRQRLLEPGA
ncbi:MAG: tyrosine-protein phosphatase [Cellvibrionaceae bacterium]|nr:tyrosine-protein phosphatase [Cellvibrionaceae bacterium]